MKSILILFCLFIGAEAISQRVLILGIDGMRSDVSEIANTPALDNLSTKELNILRLIARQKTSMEIADMLFISPKTVANHRSNISKKLSLSGEQNGLLKWAIEHRHLLT